MTAQVQEGLADRIARHIADQIISGELVEGERIQEMRIARELEVSRSSVREALLILQRTFLIEIYPHRGAMVSELTPARAKNLFTVAGLLVGHMAQHCSETWRQQELQQLQQVQARLATLHEQGQIDGFYQQVFDYFAGYSQRMENPYLAQMYRDLLPSVQRGYFLTLSTARRDLDDAATLFQAVLDAISLRKGSQAAAFASNFCQHLCQLVLESIARMKQIELAWAQRSRR